MSARPRRALRAALAVLLGCAALLVSTRALAGEAAARASFALIIGSNVSVDAELAPLKYADDDAARYLDLFRVLGARTYLLSRLDDNTRRLHPQAAAEALEPRRDALQGAVTQLAADVTRARDRGVDTVLYFVFAGHGGVREDRGYVSLEDARLTGADLARLIARVPAARVHVIIDACDSYYVAYRRGPGGERRPAGDFQDVPELATDPRVGLLLSTSSARDSHEWEAFQAGVFSHEVRSGLYGAADADGDGQVSYREIAAFVRRANAAIPNERFRPDVHARAPRESDTLLDLRRGLSRRLDIDGAHAAHYWLEDAQGVRLLDLHNAAGQEVHLVRPAPSGRVYLHRLDDDAEYTLPAAPDVVSLAELASAHARVASRGAAHEAFDRLFALPFGRAAVDEEVAPEGAEAGSARVQVRAAARPAAPDAGAARAPTSARVVLGWSAAGLGAAGLGAGAAMTLSALSTSRASTLGQSQLGVAQQNARVATLNTGAAVAYAAGGATLVGGLVLLLWPGAPPVQAAVGPAGASLGVGGAF